MRYLLMICVDEHMYGAMSPDEAAAMTAEYGKFMDEMNARGALLGGERLHLTTTATSVQVRDGEVVTIDGPFVETKEQIGGYFLVEAPSQDEAIAVAARIPGARHGTIEVRQILEL